MKPTKTIRAGLVKAAIFERDAQGSKGPFKSQSVALQISYEKDGKFINNDLTIVKKNLGQTIKVLQEAATELGVETPGVSSSCTTCPREITEFKDEISMREYKISGMCQVCQDKTFGVD